MLYPSNRTRGQDAVSSHYSNVGDVDQEVAHSHQWDTNHQSTRKIPRNRKDTRKQKVSTSSNANYMYASSTG